MGRNDETSRGEVDPFVSVHQEVDEVQKSSKEEEEK
jgi:hypothetical protein